MRAQKMRGAASRRARVVLVPALAALLTTLAGTRPARADGSRDPAAAETLFRAAKEAAKRGDYASACPQYAESERLDPAAGTLLNLADCEDRTGHPALAWAHFVEARDMLPPGDERIAFAKKREAETLKRTAKLSVRLRSSAPPNCIVKRDDVDVSTLALGREFPVDPGAHTLYARAPDGGEAKITVTLQEGESRDVVLDPSLNEKAVRNPKEAAPVPPPPKLTATEPQSDGTKTLGYVVGGVGLAGLGVGAVTGLMAFGSASTFKQHCDATGCDPQGLDAASSGKTLATVSTVGFIAGAVLTGVGAYFIFTSAPGTSVRASASLGGGNLSLVRDF